MQVNNEIVWLSDVGKNDIALAGGKGANLGELLRAGIPVPNGFIVTSAAYYRFLNEAGVREEIEKLLRDLDPEDSLRLQKVSAQIKEKILNVPMPEDLASKIKRAYRRLDTIFVAVRSSATAEDLPEASFAGQQRTFLNVNSPEAVIRAVQECWASLFEPRAIFYRAEHGFDHLKIGIAVPVQEMVRADASGVMFTMDPVTGDESKIIIEAVLGLGEAIVSGEITPDLYVINKEDLTVLEKRLGKQEWKLICNPMSDDSFNPNVKMYLSPPVQKMQKIFDSHIRELARLGKRIEELYQFPQDIEWAISESKVYIVQSRPVTTLKLKKRVELPEPEADPILVGIDASPGIAAGPVKIVPGPEDIHKVDHGDVLVTEMTTPDFVPAMKRAAAIVTDKGGKTAHAAIVSRELGIPCVVGTGRATQILRDNQVVTVDGSRGKVYEGNVIPEKAIELTRTTPRIKTVTKVYVNLAEPDLAERVARRDVDGVGLLRAEFMIAHIGEHPRYMLAQGRGREFSEKLAEGIATFARAFHPRPVVYRTTDFKTNEYRNLKGGEEYETDEENPMLGYRGCSRYLKEPDVFRLELDAIKMVREKYDNLWVMLPFVRTVKELADIKEFMEREGLRRSHDFRLWMMVEVPSNIFLLDKFIDVGIDGISIGSNDLTQLILGIDRDNARLAEEFDERDEAVLMALEHAIKTAKRRGITSSICGQAPSFYPDLTEKLVEWGITSVSVSPDMIERTREIIATVEARLSSPSRVRRWARSWEFEEP